MISSAIIILFLCSASNGYISTLNESEYGRMPPLFRLDPYEACLHEQDGIYCLVQFELVSDAPNELLTMIREYSERTTTHFNHSKLQQGICLTKTCRHFRIRNTTVDRKEVLEECLNESLWRDYKLKSRLTNNICEKYVEGIILDTSDIVVAVFVILVLMLNLIGSFREFYKNTKETENCFLHCFSIQRNWKRLVEPAGEGLEIRLTRLKGFYGIRSLTTMLVITCHSCLPFVINSDNPQYFEESFNNPFYLLIANGTLIVQTFFVMSGFLLAYNLQLHAEKHKITWVMFPKGILQRWLRLTAPYAVVLALITTWLRHAGSGPLWPMVLSPEVADCQRNWWLHLLYINNYVDNSNCMAPTWYVAAHFQLYIVGLIVCVILKNWSRKVTISLLIVAGFLMPAAHTYFQDLDAVVMMSPEVSRNFFITDPTFNHSYKRGHTNLAGFFIGVILGYLVFYCQETEFKFHKLARHRYVYWLAVPAGVALVSLGDIFYRDAPRLPLEFRTVYAALVRPAFSVVVSWFIVGMVFKFENVYRGILEWSGWGLWGRLSYCAYLLHVTVIRYLTGTMTSLVHTTFPHMLEKILSAVILSFVLAVPLHLLVEVPIQRMVKLWTGPAGEQKQSDLEANKVEVQRF